MRQSMRALWLSFIAVWWLGTMAWGAAPSQREGGMFGLGDQYPIVLMGVHPTDADFQHAKNLGANYVHDYTLKSEQAYLDLAEKYGLKVMLQGPSARNASKNKPGWRDAMRQFVDRYKDHPALGFWYPSDEPDLRYSAQTFEEIYHLIKGESPDIPMCILTSVGPKWNIFFPNLDIYSFDVYPVATAPFPQAHLDRVIQYNYWALKKGKPVLPCVQAFNWVIYQAKHALDDGTFNKPDVQKRLTSYRYPTLEELRYWSFGTLVQGARGIIYWDYDVSRRTQYGDKAYAGKLEEMGQKDWLKEKGNIDPDWVDKTLKPAIAELKSFTDLVAPAWEHEVLAGDVTQSLLEGSWKRDGKTYVVLVNNTPGERSRAELNEKMGAPFEEGDITPWGFSRKIQPVKKSFGGWMVTDMKPWEVLVWEIQPKQ